MAIATREMAWMPRISDQEAEAAAVQDRFGYEGLTFDDVLLVPGYTETLPANVNISVQLHERVRLNIPMISAAMDTVTESELAIALARQGGLGVIHRNLSPQQQAEEIDKVKRSESGMIVDPVTLSPDATLSEAEAVMSRYRISGIPITGEGGKLVGILTNRDVRFATDYGRPIAEYMTQGELITAKLGTTLAEAQEILHRFRIEKLPLVDEQGNLKGLITYKDILKRQDYPFAAKDEQGRLMVAAAVGVARRVLNEPVSCWMRGWMRSPSIQRMDTAVMSSKRWQGYASISPTP
jgi:IMP dehydrogenase